MYRSDTIELAQTWNFDFDTGVPGDPGIWFEAVTGSERYLVGPIAVVGDVSVGEAGCQARDISPSVRIPIEKFKDGTWACFRTPQGRLGEFQVKTTSSYSPNPIKLTYTVWK